MGRDGGISWPAAQQAIKRIIEIYTRILGILVGFYFADQSNMERESVSLDAFTFAFSIVLTWSMVIPITSFISETIEAAIRIIDSVSVLSTSLTASAVSFYFAKEQRKNTALPQGRRDDDARNGN
jgi:hypothetical protein